jgi:hypothetical protein
MPTGWRKRVNNMSQISQLANYIRACRYVSYDKVVDEAERINPLWREGTWTRGLRRTKDIKAIYKGNPLNSPIIAYEAEAAYTPLAQRVSNPVQLLFL